jgi:hypothetical protein
MGAEREGSGEDAELGEDDSLGYHESNEVYRQSLGGDLDAEHIALDRQPSWRPDFTFKVSNVKRAVAVWQNSVKLSKCCHEPACSILRSRCYVLQLCKASQDIRSPDNALLALTATEVSFCHVLRPLQYSSPHVPLRKQHSSYVHSNQQSKPWT